MAERQLPRPFEDLEPSLERPFPPGREQRTQGISITAHLFRANEPALARRGVASRARQTVVRNLLLVMLLVGGTLAFLLPCATVHADSAASPQRTWKTVAELSPEERAAIDFSPETPRHAEFPYLPAELFPFAPPYTAEEMGLRAMEFSYWRRWTSSTSQVYGSVDARGYMPTWGKCVTSVSYHVADGLAGYLYAKPGENYSSALLQYLAPPEVFGNQSLYVRYRTDQTFTTKQDTFRYSSALRRVRRYPAPPRQEKYPAYPYTYDDDVGRDAWEFSWKLLGTDVLFHTVRFPVTRPAITLANADGGFRDVPTSAIKLMGEAYPWYTPEGGVRCYVVEATAKPDWLPNYYAPRILYWLDQHTFFPLRIEQYGRDGTLIFIGVRLGALINPALGERGYSSVAHVDWHLSADLLSYLLTDTNLAQSWTAADQALFFTPGFLPREWRLASLKSQAEVATPQEFFLRPGLEEEKFPSERRIELSAELRARVRAQERAGRLVFTGE
ncbi:MAG TPA: outer membrane lipoprotein-sorting protein [Candidatus Binatia bacterium]|nr:outer membrane lipoprotein-sorting protein [Candidatus Binatia bacterium]